MVDTTKIARQSARQMASAVLSRLMRLGLSGSRQQFSAFGFQIGIPDAVDHRNRGEESKHPECSRHHSPVVAERTQDDADNALGTLHKPYLAGADQCLGA